MARTQSSLQGLSDLRMADHLAGQHHRHQGADAAQCLGARHGRALGDGVQGQSGPTALAHLRSGADVVGDGGVERDGVHASVSSCIRRASQRRRNSSYSTSVATGAIQKCSSASASSSSGLMSAGSSVCRASMAVWT
ncbi:MAG: hypothetical protein MZU84_03360 [Sphingobacterium sp.]|nr:hypothetical protein [Sphingobacterium sp.]